MKILMTLYNHGKLKMNKDWKSSKNKIKKTDALFLNPAMRPEAAKHIHQYEYKI